MCVAFGRQRLLHCPRRRAPGRNWRRAPGSSAALESRAAKLADEREHLVFQRWVLHEELRPRRAHKLPRPAKSRHFLRVIRILSYLLSFPGAAVCARGGRNECSEYRTHRSKLEAQWSGCGHSACWPSRVAPLGGRPPTFRCLIAFWAQIARRFRFSDYFSENKDETRKCQAISTSSPLGQFS